MKLRKKYKMTARCDQRKAMQKKIERINLTMKRMKLRYLQFIRASPDKLE